MPRSCLEIWVPLSRQLQGPTLSLHWSPCMAPKMGGKSWPFAPALLSEYLLSGYRAACLLETKALARFLVQPLCGLALAVDSRSPASVSWSYLPYRAMPLSFQMSVVDIAVIAQKWSL